MEDACPECGLQPGAGRPSCEAQRHELLARDFEQPALYWSFHRMAVDACCLQHSPYIASAKSFAAHLCDLCIAFDQANDAAQLRQLQRWLSTNPKIEKPDYLPLEVISRLARCTALAIRFSTVKP